MGLFGISERDLNENKHYPKSKMSRHAHEPIAQKKMHSIFGTRPANSMPQKLRQVDIRNVVIHHRFVTKKLSFFRQMFNSFHNTMKSMLKKINKFLRFKR